MLLIRSLFILLFLFLSFSSVSCENCEQKFTKIYEEGIWGKNKKGEGTSGSGSILENAEPFVIFLRGVLKSHDIQRVVDLGCGDWELYKYIDWSGLRYIGYDVVESVIDANKSKYQNSSISFIHANAAEVELPEADLLICKDVLQHLSYKSIRKIVRQFDRFRYVLIVNDVGMKFPQSKEIVRYPNIDILDGGYRLLDMHKPPFSIAPLICFEFMSSKVHLKKVTLIRN